MPPSSAESVADPRRAILLTMDLRANEGRPHGGSNRPFGYEADKVTVRESEAAIIRIIVARFLAGESLRSMAMWLESAGVQTVRGRPWKTPTLATMLTSGRIAGLREHHGVVVAKAVWDPIISESERDLVLAMFMRRKSSRVGVRHHYLLTGLLRCGKCGNSLYSSARTSGRRYVCMSGPDHRGCGKLAVVATPIEHDLVEAALDRFDALREMDRPLVLGPFESGATIRAIWAELGMDQRHKFMKAMLHHVLIEGRRAGRAFDSTRVRPKWRFEMIESSSGR